MRTHWFCALLACGALAGCPSAEDPPPPANDDDSVEPTEVLPEPATWDGHVPDRACEVPLSLSTQYPAAEAHGLLHVTVTGGSGANVVTVQSNESGALFSDGVRSYIAGTTVGVTDVLHARDLDCYGEATLAIDVVEPLQVRPADGEVLPGDVFALTAVGGSGDVTYTPIFLRSGGSLSADGAYVAGPTDGEDEFEAFDEQTGVLIEAVLRVRSDAALAPRPAHLVMPIGVTMPLSIDGGSGWTNVTPDLTGPLDLDPDDNSMTAVAPGRVTMSVADAYATLSTEVVVDVVATQTAPMPRAGIGSFRALALGPGDLNGDGFPDALLGVMESNIAAHRSGAIYVYPGGPSGLEPTPVQTFTWPDWTAEVGEDFLVRDLDGDGELDLVLGAPQADTDRSAQGLVPSEDTGAVAIYPGVAGGFFADSPSQTLFGQYGGDRFGKSLGLCDVNGDGADDLIVGARYAEDRSYGPIQYSAGGVHVFLGDGTGAFAELPDQSVYGVMPDGGGGWIPDASQEFGYDLGVGDVDGDGLCDLVVGSYNFSTGPGRSRDNLVTVWRGQADAAHGAPVTGGVLPWPVLAIAPTDPEHHQSYFGREIKVADLDQDGKSDIVIGHYRRTDPNLSSVYHGAVRVYEGRDLGTAGATSITPAATAIWEVGGTNSYDYFGAQVDVFDVDDDGLLDLVVGESREEGDGSPNDAGAVSVFLGQQDDFPDTNRAFRVFGSEGDGRLGVAVAGLGDVDGDGAPDLMGFGAYEDLYGYTVGVPWYFPGLDTTNPAVALELPGASSGQYFGIGLAVIGDVDDDGFDDFAVGGSEYSSSTSLRPGAAWVYLGSSLGWSDTPDATLEGFSGHSSYDRFGYRVSPAGDFDGDGIDDYAVVARYEDKPNTFGSAFNHTGDCPSGTKNDVGAVYVFRGATGALATEPSFVIYGPQVSQRIDTLDGGGDMNGDGLGDLLFGGWDWDGSAGSNTGGFAMVGGRPWSGAGIDVICTYDLEYYAPNAGDRLARDLAFVGDLDGDGCDEVAVGAYLADHTAGNEGAVHVFKGFAGPSCPVEPTMAIVTPRDSNDQAGTGVGGGGDVDGDGILDIAVGAPWYYGNGASRGSVWLLSGSHVLSLPFEVLGSHSGTTYAMWDESDGDKEMWRVPGVAASERLGQDVTILPSDGVNPALIVAGAPRGAGTGEEWSGGAKLFAWSGPPGSSGRLDANPAAAFSGEATRDGWSGYALWAGEVDGSIGLGIGGYRSDAQGLDQGAAWIVEMGQ